MAASPDYQSAEAYFPSRLSLSGLKKSARGCRACPLWLSGTQTVFGEGLKRARLMFVGEQPGDREDLEGRPFVGPAGRVLDEGLERSGIPRSEAYVTNVVKHFKWEPRGRRRLHKKPNRREVGACLPWLDAEIRVVDPELVVCLGATAAQALLGPSFRVTQQRGRLLESELASRVLATVHPSSILRSRDDAERRAAMDAFVRDLERAAEVLRDGGAGGRATP